MSEAYEDDLADEQALFDRIEAANAGGGGFGGDIEPPINTGGRPHKIEPIKLVAWRQAHKASIAETAKRWSVSPATVKRLTRDYADAAKLERQRWESERLDHELWQHEYDLAMMFLGQRNKHLAFVDQFHWFGRCKRAKGTDQEAAVNAARDAAIEEADREFRETWERCMGPIPGYPAPLQGGNP